MAKTLTKHGNSYALVIDKPILEMLQITPETPLELFTNGDTLVIRPVRDKTRQKRLDQTLDEINRKYISQPVDLIVQASLHASRERSDHPLNTTTTLSQPTADR